MKKTGWLMITVSGLIVAYNLHLCSYNQEQAVTHPFKTLFTLGSNLKHCYHFTPPFTFFETLVIANGIVGLVLVFLSDNTSRQIQQPGTRL